MGKIRDSIKTQPYLLSMSQIEVVEENINASNEKVIGKVSEILKDIEFNLVLPIACLTEKEDKYRLLTGVNIYEAAKVAGFKELWVFLISSSQLVESKKVFEQVLTLSKLNEIAIESKDSADFLVVLNTETISKLCSLKIGIGPKTAPKIVDNRSYSTLNEVQEKFGARRVLRWLRTYKQKS
jgi:DNA uptake protein ComE-like DNA-binding protein